MHLEKIHVQTSVSKKHISSDDDIPMVQLLNSSTTPVLNLLFQDLLFLPIDALLRNLFKKNREKKHSKNFDFHAVKESIGKKRRKKLKKKTKTKEDSERNCEN